MGSVEDKREGQKALHSLRSSWCPAWHSPLCYEKEQGKVHQKRKASTQEKAAAVPCVPEPGNTTHRPEENKEGTRSACVSTHTYVCVVHTHALHLPIQPLFWSSTEPALIPRCTQRQAAPRQRQLEPGNTKSGRTYCRCSVPRPCRACDLSWRDTAGDSELSLLSTSPAHSPPRRQIGPSPSLLSYRHATLGRPALSPVLLLPSRALSSPFQHTPSSDPASHAHEKKATMSSAAFQRGLSTAPSPSPARQVKAPWEPCYWICSCS